MEVEPGCHPVAFDEWNRYRTLANLESPHLGLESQHLLPIQGQLDFLRRKLFPTQIAQTPQGHLFGHDASGRPETDALKLHCHAALAKGLEKAILETFRDTHLVEVGSQSDDHSQDQVDEPSPDPKESPWPSPTGPDRTSSRTILRIRAVGRVHGFVSLEVTGGALNQEPMYS